MPGRGRGSFGTKFSFDLAALGFGGRFGLSQLTSAQQPPSSFPPLDAQPAKLINDNEHEYLVELSRNFHSLVNDSAFYLRPLNAPQPFIERYADIVAAEAEQTNQEKNKGKVSWPNKDLWPIDWDRFPVELRPKKLRLDIALSLPSALVSASKSSSKSEKRKSVDSKKGGNGVFKEKRRRLRVKEEEEEVDEEAIQKRLAALEQLEGQPDGDSEILPAAAIKQEMIDIEEPNADENGNQNGQKKVSSDNEDDSGEEEVADDAAEEDYEEEMGDYGESYFDNGEGFDDDDDNDNEGPTY